MSLWSRSARALLCLLAVGVLLGGVISPAQAAKGGNSANAKKCQKGGWQDLYSSTGGFSSEKECTSYAARGGTLSTTPPTPPSQYPLASAKCAELGGTWTERGGPDFGETFRCSDGSRELTDGEADALFQECDAQNTDQYQVQFEAGAVSPFYFACTYF